MGAGEPAVVSGTIDTITGIRAGTVFSGARGECLEDALEGVKVQLGCGHKPWDGWINVDGPRAASHADLVADLREIPLESGIADVVAAIHVFEHFYQWETGAVLAEWKRLLKPGGKLILELPSFDKVVDYLTVCKAKGKPAWMQMAWWALWGDPRYKDPAMTHKWGYTEPLMRQTVEAAGFERVMIMEPRYHLKVRDMRVEAYNPL